MKRLVCFGDSITAGTEEGSDPILTNKLSSMLTGYEVINAGVNGNNTNDALQRMEQDVLQWKPDFVTVLFGANDAAFQKMVDIQTYKHNLMEMTDLIGSEKTILISPSPVDENLQQTRTNEVLKRYSQTVEAVSFATGCRFIDFFTLLHSRENYTDILAGISNDGLHFGEKGYEFLADLIVKKIKPLTL